MGVSAGRSTTLTAGTTVPISHFRALLRRRIRRCRRAKGAPAGARRLRGVCPGPWRGLRCRRCSSRWAGRGQLRRRPRPAGSATAAASGHPRAGGRAGRLVARHAAVRRARPGPLGAPVDDRAPGRGRRGRARDPASRSLGRFVEAMLEARDRRPERTGGGTMPTPCATGWWRLGVEVGDSQRARLAAAILIEPSIGFRPPSSSGLGHRPFKAAARVRIPLGVRRVNGPVVQFGVHAGLSSRRSRVQIPSGPQRAGTVTSTTPGRVAQLAERAPEKREVTGSTPVPTTTKVLVRGVEASHPPVEPSAFRARSVPEGSGTVVDRPGHGRVVPGTHEHLVERLSDPPVPFDQPRVGRSATPSDWHAQVWP